MTHPCLRCGSERSIKMVTRDGRVVCENPPACKARVEAARKRRYCLA